MKKRVIKLRESDLERLVNKILKEDMGGMDDGHPVFGDLNFSLLSPEEKEEIATYFSGKSKKSDDYKDRSMYDPYYGDGDLEHGTFDDESQELEESKKRIQRNIKRKFKS